MAQAVIGALRVDLGMDSAEFERGSRRAIDQTKRMGAEMTRAGGVSNSFRSSLQNTGYQVQDFAVQVASGTSASRALAQQLPQLLSGFGLLGVALGTAAAVFIPLAAAMFSFGEEAVSAAKATEALEGGIKSLKSEVSTLKDLQESYIDAVVSGQAQVAESIAGEIRLRSALLQVRRFEIQQQVEAARAAVETTKAQIEAVRQEAAQISRSIDQDAANLAFTRTQGYQAAQEAVRRLIDENKDLFRENEKQTLELGLQENLLQQLDRVMAEVASTAAALTSETANTAANIGNAAKGAEMLRDRLLEAVNAERARRALDAAGSGNALGPDEARFGVMDARPKRDVISAADMKRAAGIKEVGKAAGKAAKDVDKFSESLSWVKREMSDAEKQARQLEDQLYAFQDLDTFIVKSGEALHQSLSDFLFDPFQDGLRGMVLGFSNALRRMASDAIAAQLTQLIFGAFGGFGGSAQPFMGFGTSIPFFAGGTSYAPGGLAVVGERGPELVNLPRGSQVVPNDQIGGAGTRVVVFDDKMRALDALNTPEGDVIFVDLARRNGVI